MHAWFEAYDLLILRLQGLNHLIASKFMACSSVSEKVNSLLTLGMKVGTVSSLLNSSDWKMKSLARSMLNDWGKRILCC